MSKKEKKQKKKFQLDYVSSLFLSSFLFAIAYDCFKNNKGQGFNTNVIFGIVLILACIFIMFRAMKDVVKKRREMLIAEAERREKEAAEAELNASLEDAPSESEEDDEAEAIEESDSSGEK